MICPVCASEMNETWCISCGYKDPNAVSKFWLQQGRYEVIKYLAEGGMGKVFLAKDHILNQTCVLKQAIPQGSSTERAEQLALFKREAEILANLHHPNIAAVWDYFEEGQKHYLVEEFLDGGSLNDQTQPMSEWEAVEVGVDVAKALAYLHERNIVYRDLKPGNVMMRQGQEVLADFGIARIFKPGKQGDTVLFGTPGYSPPEQFSKSIQTTPASDIFSWGITMFNLLSAEPPEKFRTGITEPVLPISHFRSDLSLAIQGIIERAVQPKIKERFATGHELLLALLPLRQAHHNAHCTCGQRNPLGSDRCSTCGKPLLRINAVQSVQRSTTDLKLPLHQAWFTKLNDPIRGGVLLWQSQLYVAGQTGHLYTLNLWGQELNRQTLGASSRSTPALIEGIVVGTFDGLWREGETFAIGEVFAPPTPYGKRAYTATYLGELVCTEGQYLLWRRLFSGGSVVSPVVSQNTVTVFNKKGLVATYDHLGNQVWRAKLDSGVYGPSLVTDKGMLVLSETGRLYLLASDGTMLTSMAVCGPTKGGIAGFEGGLVFTDNQGTVTCLDTSLRTSWVYEMRTRVVATPSVIGNMVLVPTLEGELAILDASHGSLLQQIHLGPRMASSVSADANSVFVAGLDGEVVALVGSR